MIAPITAICRIANRLDWPVEAALGNNDAAQIRSMTAKSYSAVLRPTYFGYLPLTYRKLGVERTMRRNDRDSGIGEVKDYGAIINSI